MSSGVSLGIDISTASFHAAMLKAENRANVKEFANTEAGFEALSEG
jgi:transposase